MVIGAGMGGLATAMALSRHFEQRDAPRSRQAAVGARTPDRNAAGVAYSCAAVQRTASVGAAFPGFKHALEDAGAVKVRAGLDVIWKRPGYGPFPIRDLGFEIGIDVGYPGTIFEAPERRSLSRDAGGGVAISRARGSWN
jgi:hypothetical protein